MEQKPVRDEIATVQIDVTYPAYAGIMRIVDPTLLSRAGALGVRLYDEVEGDTHVFSVLQKRKGAVIARPWTVVAASNSRADKKAADLVREQLNNMGSAALLGNDAQIPVAGNFDLACLNLLDAILKGYSVAEVMWDYDGAEIVATEIRARNQFRFNFDENYCLRLKLLDNYIPGIALPPRKFIAHAFGAKDGNPLGLGLGSRLYWPAFFKRNGLVFWSTFLDKFGSPTPVGTYAAGSDPKTQSDLLAALAAIAQDTGIAIPDNTKIAFLEASRSGTVTHEMFCKYMDDQISECVLGETMTTSARGGAGLNAGGQAQVQNEVRLELVKADADLLSSTLNSTLIPWISLYNMPNATPPKVWRQVEEAKDLAAQATRDKMIFDMGFRPTLNYIQDTYGGEWEDMKAIPPASGNMPTPIPSMPVSPDATSAFAEDPQQMLAGTLNQKAADPWRQVINHLETLVNQAGSMQELKSSIENAYAGLPLDDLAAVMSMGYAAAHLAGMSDVQDGN